jgi:hypothetical protein
MYVVSLKALLGPPPPFHILSMLMSLIVLGFVEGIFVRQELLRMKINGLNPDSTHPVSTFYLFVFVLSKKI